MRTVEAIVKINKRHARALKRAKKLPRAGNPRAKDAGRFRDECIAKANAERREALRAVLGNVRGAR